MNKWHTKEDSKDTEPTCSDASCGGATVLIELSQLEELFGVEKVWCLRCQTVGSYLHGSLVYKSGGGDLDK